MKIFYNVFIFFLCCFQLVNAQQNTIKHKVKKGENVYRIGLKYGVSPEQIYQLNPGSSESIYVGQVLIIPSSKENSSTTTSTSQNTNGSFTHIVKQGETKFGLAKQFGISIAELEHDNPQIKDGLQVGHELTINKGTSGVSIPKKPSYTTSNPSTVDEAVETLKKANGKVEYYSYKIKPKETLYSLSVDAGMKPSEFLILNPELVNGVKEGDIVKMPKTETTKASSSIEENNSTTATIAATSSKYDNLVSTLDHSKNTELLFLFPYSEKEMSDRLRNVNQFSEVQDSVLRQNLEFYRGAQLAIDSLKKMGLKFDLDIVKMESEKLLLKPNPNKNARAVIWPFKNTKTEEATLMFATQDIPVVTLENTSTKPGLVNIYEAVPSQTTQREAILNYIKRNSSNNVIVINDKYRRESKNFISNWLPEAQFLNVKSNGTFQDDELLGLLQNSKNNIIIFDTDKNSTYLSTTTLLLSQVSNYNIQLAVIDSDLIPDDAEVSSKRFRILKMMYPSASALKQSNATNAFIKKYKYQYKSTPTQNVIYGFDITYDTLLRMAQSGSFENAVKNNVTEYINIKFDYRPNAKGSYDNKGVYIIQYDAESFLKELN
ncbi:lytic transglycosylase [Mangrovimonas xylaniphaga]|uniref:lytic transglycosylase n=1 Tax=Mangrovimonas xylaniphaga TaxID=1645915 RepID=UPI0006B5CF3E|nr:LysM peptidoglycan-binding domain-containing protein [Mangrovimonas xylaniphaga]